MRYCRFLLIALPAFGAFGCASVTFHPSIQATGEYRNTQSIVDAAEALPEHSADDVKVLVDALPDGMSIEGGQLVFDHAKYQMLGRVGADYAHFRGANLGFLFYRYKESEGWRTHLCEWQVPLTWLTLGAWAFVMPTYLPCRVGFGSEEGRRGDVVETMQRATKALGGNLVIVAGFGGEDFVSVTSHSFGNVAIARVDSDHVGVLSGSGYAFHSIALSREPKGP